MKNPGHLPLAGPRFASEQDRAIAPRGVLDAVANGPHGRTATPDKAVHGSRSIPVLSHPLPIARPEKEDKGEAECMNVF